MRKLLFIILLILLSSCGEKHSAYRGSRSCRECHEHFYALWEDSQHGLAMQDFNADFAKTALSPCDSAIRSGDDYYRYVLRGKRAYIVRSSDKKRFPVSYALGGKYLYYFLTPFGKGKLQTLPLGYDVRSKSWFDITESALRVHQDIPDQALSWTDRRYTFNTACYSCHVSQLSSSYDFSKDRYRSSWLESGINCETCHGPADKHNAIFKDAEKQGYQPDSIYLRTLTQDRGYTAEQVNAVCSYCHAKMIALTPEYIPADDFFNHYDLVTYENPDYYPDGRDLGENYTYSSWIMSSCVRNSNLDCLHCHSSSGRYLQKDSPNHSCLPCHSERVANAAEHSFHAPESEGSLCISCHMPQSEFARMLRSDHSMRPPMPALSEIFGSPNACNLCHSDKSPAWADSLIRLRYSARFQEETLAWAEILDSLRRGNIPGPEKIIDQLCKNYLEIVPASILRSLPREREEAYLPIFRKFLQSPSPLLRASVLMNLSLDQYPEMRESLLAACADSILLVRIRAAEALDGLPDSYVPERYRPAFLRAREEYRESLGIFPDIEMSHYNLGNHYRANGNIKAAAAAYRRALKLRSDYAEAAINLGLLYYENAIMDSALFFLQKAANEHPQLPAAQLNLGMLYSELGNKSGAIQCFLSAYNLNTSTSAAYNLAILYLGDKPETAVNWAMLAYEKEQKNPRYIYLYAYSLYQSGESRDALKILDKAFEADIKSEEMQILYRKLNKDS